MDISGRACAAKARNLYGHRVATNLTAKGASRLVGMPLSRRRTERWTAFTLRGLFPQSPRVLRATQPVPRRSDVRRARWVVAPMPLGGQRRFGAHGRRPLEIPPAAFVASS